MGIGGLFLVAPRTRRDGLALLFMGPVLAQQWLPAKTKGADGHRRG